MSVNPMTRHARCRAAIAGEPVDRAPAYLPGISCAVASRLLGRPVHAGTGSLHYAEACAWMRGASAHAEFEAQLYDDLAAIFRALDIDVYRMPWRMRAQPARQLDEYTFLYGEPDGAHTIYRYNPHSTDFGPIASAGGNAEPYEVQLPRLLEAREAAIASGSLADVAITDEHRTLCARFGEEFFVLCEGGGISVGWGEEPLMLMASAPGLMQRDVMIQARHALALGQALAQSGFPRVLVAGGDMAGNGGPFYSPRSFREVMLPALNWLMHGLAACGVHYIFRSDGNLWPVADMLFGEAACPGYGEVDRDAGMTTARLRVRYPKLVIWGNMSVSQLASHSPAWVREEAQAMIEESAGSGYFHGPSNAILGDTPVENMVAFFGVR